MSTTPTMIISGNRLVHFGKTSDIFTFFVQPAPKYVWPVSSPNHEKCDSCHWNSCVNCFLTKSLPPTAPQIRFGSRKNENYPHHDHGKIKPLAPAPQESL